MKSTILLALALLLPFASGAPALDANVAADDTEESCTGPRDRYQGSWSDPNGTTSYDVTYYDEQCATSDSAARASVSADGERVAGVEAGERGEESRQGAEYATERHDTTCGGAPCDRTRTLHTAYDSTTGTSERGVFVDAMEHDARVTTERCAGASSMWQDETSTHDNETGESTYDSEHSNYRERTCAKGAWLATDGEDVASAELYGCYDRAGDWDYAWNGARYWGNETYEGCGLAREERVEVEGTGILLDIAYWQGDWTGCGASSSQPNGSCWNYNGTGGRASLRTFGAAGDHWLLYQERWIDYVRILP